jgi:hypothetical protein
MGARKQAIVQSIFALGLLLSAGCGDAPEAPADRPAAEGAGGVSAGNFVDGDIEAVAYAERGGSPADPPAEGSPEWLLLEIDRLRAQPLAESGDLDAQRDERVRRHREIIKLAEQVVSATHSDAHQERVFTAAVQRLLEARRQLALLGDTDQVDALYEHADALYRRDPASPAAANAAYLLAEFVYEVARRPSPEQARWIAEFAAQARTFARSFPLEHTRGAPLLLSAGRTCELHRFPDDAVACYTLLQEQFPNSPEALQSVAIVRRLHLIGHPPQLTGPTLDGAFFTGDELRGQPVIVVFWASDSDRFRADLPQLLSLSADRADAPAIVGVCLDDDDAAVRAFVEQAGITWPQIFSPDRHKRRWQHPLAEYYGVQDIPMYWLLDQDGNLAWQGFHSSQIAGQLQTLPTRR